MKNKKNKNSKIYNKLRDKASYPLVFYAPLDYFSHYLEKEQIHAIEWLFDRIAYASKKMEVIFMDENEITFDILKKNTKLRENLFELVDLHNDLNENQFIFILENYKDHIMAMDYFSDLMLGDIKRRFKNDYQKYYSLFSLQSSYFKEHRQSIDKAFPSYIERYKREIDPNAFLTENITKKEKTKKAPKKNKEKLISDLESQNFLLETVFNLDPKLLNQRLLQSL